MNFFIKKTLTDHVICMNYPYESYILTHIDYVIRMTHKDHLIRMSYTDIIRKNKKHLRIFLEFCFNVGCTSNICMVHLAKPLC